MATKSGVGLGLKFNINTGTASAPTWLLVGEGLTSDPAPKMETEDATSFDSLGREFIATIPDGGDLKFSCNRVTTDLGQAAMVAHGPMGASAGVLMPFEIVAPLATGQTTTGDTWSFMGIVTEFNPSFKPDKKTTITGNVRTSNGMTFAEGS
jgi:hypothetical protein